MVDALSSRVAAGLESRKNAELRVAALRAAAETDETSEPNTGNGPAVIKTIGPQRSMFSRALEGSDEEFGRLLNFLQRGLESTYTTGFTTPPELERYEGTKTYAEVVVGGKVVAAIDNQGVVRTENSLGASLHGKLINEVNGTNGPDLAQARADQIARMLGGSVKKADTAITQQKFASLVPPPLPERIVDRVGMESDPRFAEIQMLIQKRAEYLAT